MSESVRAVDRALDVLLCFSQDQPVLSLTQIAEQVGIPKSTVHRLLGTLEARRFVSRDTTTGFYRLGLRLIEMASLVLQDADMQQWSLPYLQRLSSECGETVDLAVLDGAHVVYLQVVESSQRVKLAAAVGQRLPAYCTASGKAFMAYLPDDQVNKILSAGVIRHTEHTRISLPDLLHDLRLTRERGFSVSKEEYESDIHAVAAPILAGNGYPVAVIAIVGPSYRLPDERISRLGDLVRQAADLIRRELGPAALSAIVSRTPLPALPESPAKGQ